ncbi:MAG: agglutinin biogenesis protein MshI [Gammaproteobacteria bacterium]|nr:agglutinin biogenesis protein MshI [Gammaproteobacteria bacterium]
MRRGRTAGGLVGIGLHADGLSLVHAVYRHERRVSILAAEYRSWDGATPARALARLADDYNLKHLRCTTYLQNGEYRLIQTEAPDVKPDELKAALRWRIKDLIDFHVNDATLDVFDVPGGHPGRPRPVYAVVARNDVIKARADLMQDAGIALDIIDIPDMAQRNVARLLPEDAGGVALVSFAQDAGLITITRGGVLYLSRALAIGASGLDKTVSRDNLLLELQRSLDFFESSFRQAPVTDVVVAGVHPGDLVAYLQANLNQRIRALAYGEIVHGSDGIEVPDVCFMTLGAALRAEKMAL